jgi:hypothetical protein
MNAYTVPPQRSYMQYIQSTALVRSATILGTLVLQTGCFTGSDGTSSDGVMFTQVFSLVPYAAALPI